MLYVNEGDFCFNATKYSRVLLLLLLLCVCVCVCVCVLSLIHI